MKKINHLASALSVAGLLITLAPNVMAEAAAGKAVYDGKGACGACMVLQVRATAPQPPYSIQNHGVLLRVSLPMIPIVMANPVQTPICLPSSKMVPPHMEVQQPCPDGPTCRMMKSTHLLLT